MAEHYDRRLTRITCDKLSCGAEEVPPEPLEWEAEREFLCAVVAKGWTIWVSRSRRTYCPQHKPNPKSKLRQITRYG